MNESDHPDERTVYVWKCGSTMLWGFTLPSNVPPEAVVDVLFVVAPEARLPDGVAALACNSVREVIGYLGGKVIRRRNTNVP